MKSPCYSLLRLSKFIRIYILQVASNDSSKSSLPVQNTGSRCRYDAAELTISPPVLL